MSALKTLEQFDADMATARAELMRKHEIMASLPAGLPGDPLISLFTRSEAWISYAVNTMQEAAEIMRAFGELDFVSARESGCLSVTRSGTHGKQYADASERWEIPECVEIRQHGGRGFYTAEIVFYPVLVAAKISVRVEQFPYEFRAHMHATYSTHGDVSKAELREPNLLRGQYTERVKFVGGSADSFDLRYYFSGPEHFADVLRLLPERQP